MPKRSPEKSLANKLVADEERQAARDWLRRVRTEDLSDAAVSLTQALAASRGGSLALQTAIEYTDLPSVSMVSWVRAQQILEDLALHAPDIHLRERAAQHAAENAQHMLELLSAQLLSAKGVVDAGGARPQPRLLNREDAVRFLDQQDAIARERRQQGLG